MNERQICVVSYCSRALCVDCRRQWTGPEQASRSLPRIPKLPAGFGWHSLLLAIIRSRLLPMPYGRIGVGWKSSENHCTVSPSYGSCCFVRVIKPFRGDANYSGHFSDCSGQDFGGDDRSEKVENQGRITAATR